MRRFTLPGLSATEILIVVALLGIMAVILWPFHPNREARRGLCASNQRQIAMAIILYAYEHGNKLPSADRVWQVIDLNPKVFFCKTAGGRPRNTYGYNQYLSGANLKSDIPNPASTMLTADIEVPER